MESLLPNSFFFFGTHVYHIAFHSAELYSQTSNIFVFPSSMIKRVFEAAHCDTMASLDEKHLPIFFYFSYLCYTRRKPKRRSQQRIMMLVAQKEWKRETGCVRRAPRFSSFFLLRKWMLQTNKRNGRRRRRSSVGD